jgi:hypothetical protein
MDQWACCLFQVVDEDYTELWWNLNPGREWAYLTLTPRTGVAAEIGVQMWNETHPDSPQRDDMLIIDPVALEALLVLGGAGEVETELGTVAADSVAAFMLRDHYREGQDPLERRRIMVDMAARSLAELAGGDADPLTMLDVLDQLIAERHLIAWSRDPQRQGYWAALGMDGAMADNSLMVSLLNPGGNKLDAYLAVNADLVTTSRVDGSLGAVLSYTVENNATGDEVGYVTGLERGLGASHVVSLAGVHLPGAASAIEYYIDGELVEVLSGPDGPSIFVAGALDLAPGGSSSVEVRFVLPAGFDTLSLEPSARWPAINWRINGEAFADRRTLIPLP